MAFLEKNQEKARRSVYVAFEDDDSSRLLLNEMSLKNHFRKYGSVLQTGIGKKFAIVEFETETAADSCLHEKVQNCFGIELKISPREAKARSKFTDKNTEANTENEFISSLFSGLGSCYSIEEQIQTLSNSYLDDNQPGNENSIYLHAAKICDIIRKIVFRYRGVTIIGLFHRNVLV